MNKDMQHVKVFLTNENIEYIKSIGSFAQVLNFLVQEMRNNPNLQKHIQQEIMENNQHDKRSN